MHYTDTDNTIPVKDIAFLHNKLAGPITSRNVLRLCLISEHSTILLTKVYLLCQRAFKYLSARYL